MLFILEPIGESVQVDPDTLVHDRLGNNPKAMSHPPSDTDPTLRCARQVQAAVTALSRQLRARPDQPGLSSAKLSVLAQLYRHGPLTPSELARREQVRLQTLTRLLADLEAQGSLQRSPHATDARQSVLTLSAPGRSLLAQEARRREAALAEGIAQRLSDAEVQTLLDASALLERLADALATEPAGAVRSDT
jgi:DNA-binding MarR family transcriptional regulator